MNAWVIGKRVAHGLRTLWKAIIAHGVRVAWAAAVLFPSLAHASLLTLPHESGTLGNGLRYVFIQYPSPGVVAYELAVHAGSRNEVEPGKTGFAHFFEHLMFRGTKKLSSKALNDTYTRLGIENNAWTDIDMTAYHGEVATVYLPQLLAVEAERFAHLYFDEKALRDEAGAVLGEYNKDVASPEMKLEEALRATAFKVHPYAHTTMGYKEDILKFTQRYKDVWPFFKRYYRPSNVSVVLVGDVDFKKALALLKADFGSWQNPKTAPVAIPSEPEQTEPRATQVTQDKPTQTRITVAYKVPAFSTKNTDSASNAVLAEVLFSTTSEFQKEYRFKKKWVDSVDADAQETVDPGLWTISLRLSAEGEGKVLELEDAVAAALEDVRLHEPDPAKVAATKKRFRSSALTSWFTEPGRLAGRIAWYTNFEPDLGVIDRLFARVEEVTPTKLTEFARRYLVDARKTTVVLTTALKGQGSGQ